MHDSAPELDGAFAVQVPHVHRLQELHVLLSAHHREVWYRAQLLVGQHPERFRGRGEPVPASDWTLLVHLQEEYILRSAQVWFVVFALLEICRVSKSDHILRLHLKLYVDSRGDGRLLVRVRLYFDGAEGRLHRNRGGERLLILCVALLSEGRLVPEPTELSEAVVSEEPRASEVLVLKLELLRLRLLLVHLLRLLLRVCDELVHRIRVQLLVRD